jgi:ABC-type Mn2+/Zn2+ transport system ATPase subunit
MCCVQPTPLYVMDEIDAALDFKNVSIVANYIKERTRNAQFVIISLRNNMFELADRLIGIYKTFDVTKCVAINPKELAVPSSAVEAEDGGDHAALSAVAPPTSTRPTKRVAVESRGARATLPL